MQAARGSPEQGDADVALCAAMELWFFDDGLGRFGPLTDLAAGFELLAGGRTLRERAQGRLRSEAAVLWVPAELAELTAESTQLRVNPPDGELNLSARVRLINGRWNGLDGGLGAQLAALPAGTAVLDAGGAVVGLAAGAGAAAAWVRGGCVGLPEAVAARAEVASRDTVLLARPWDLLDQLALGLVVDAEEWLPKRSAELDSARTCSEGVHVDARARVHPTAVIDGAPGPVVVEAGAVVGPFVWVEGPAWIGAGSVLAPHTQLRGPVAVGPGCKIGGEVKTAVFAADTNKAHGGYLGDALVSSWSNLGAGTTASNLKNTYGPVRVRLCATGDRENTGRTFQGPVIGAFVRTAVGTRLPTGAVVGTGACLAGSAIAPSFVPPMTFITDESVVSMHEAAFLGTVGRQMARRGRAPGPALQSRLRVILAEARGSATV